jgi:pyrroline-5-carboxylate reductase
MTVTAALVGGGRMGGAMLRGWADQGLAMDLAVFEPVPTGDLAELIGARGWTLNPVRETLAARDLVVLAVKPQSFAQACAETLAGLIGPDTLVISIMAGISAQKLSEGTGSRRVVRAMPNTPGQIGAGITPYFCGPNVGDEGEALTVSLLSPLGAVERVAAEKHMDAVTAVSGSGPAYLFMLTEALAAAGEAEGLDPDLAARLARQTIIGSAALMAASPQTPLELRKAVTSPQGTTAAAVDVLMANGGGMVGLMKRAVEAATIRSRQLGK